MNAIRRLSEDRGPRIVSRQPSSSKFRRQSVETARHWVHTKHWWKYSPPFLLLLLLLLVRNFPESRNSTLLDPVAEVLKLQRDWIAEEMKEFEEQTEGEKVEIKRIVVVSSWRSGSSLIGGLFDSHPGMMYIHEPFQDYGAKIIRRNQRLAAVRLNSLFQCQFQNLTSYLSYEKENKVGFPQNPRLWRWCKRDSFSCWEASFLDRFCALFPRVTIKTVRLPLSALVPLLQVGLVDRVLLVVRDPRGALVSRRKLWWCDSPDCTEANRHCNDLEAAFHKFKKLSQQYPGQVGAVRYDDFITRPEQMAAEILSWAGLGWTSASKKYILARTTRNLKAKSPYSTFESSATNSWIRSGWQTISKIQADCTAAMKVWGYQPLNASAVAAQIIPMCQPFDGLFNLS